MSRKNALKIFPNFLLNFSSKNPGIANNLTTAISALFVGTLFSIYLVGKNILPTETDWLFYEDPATFQIGWMSFRNDSWHWPLTFTENLGYPTGVSISYTDSIPIFAIVFKLLSSLIPENFQYFGILILLNLILQFFWGSQLGLLLSKGKLPFSLGAGALFMLAPPLMWRFHGHFSLTSHWLILASLWSYFRLRTSDTGDKQIFLIQAAIVIFASGVNPYIALMSLSLIVVSYLELLGLKKTTLKIALAKISSLILLLLLGWYFFGYLSGSSSIGNSYGVYSLNLSSIFNPIGYSPFLQSFPLGTSEGQYGQHEGFNYLGLGVLLLLLSNLLLGTLKHKAQRDTFINLIKEYRFLLLLALVLTIVALSNKIFWQDILVLEYPLPKIAEKLLGSFRCSGRLFWPVHYLILLATLVSTLRFWTLRQTQLLLALIISIQFLDTLPLQDSVTRKIHTIRPPGPLFSREWTQLSQQHSKLIIIPSFQCGGPPKGAEFPVFEKLAALQGLKTNSVYLARYTSSQIKTACEQLPQSVSSGQLEEDAAYVLDNKQYFDLYARHDLNANFSHRCSDIDGFILCTNRQSSISGKKIRPASYRLGTVLDFTDPRSAIRYQVGQWSVPESTGTWTNGKESHLWMDIKEPVKNDLLLIVEALPFLHKNHPKQVVDVLINDQFLTQWVFSNTDNQPNAKRTVRLPKNLVNRQSELKITFRFLDPVSPKSVGLNDDERDLGLLFQKLQLSNAKLMS